MKIKSINKIFAFFAFLISFVVYLVSMAPTTSLWDTGEFIATSHTLGVAHPPGAPFYTLIGNVISNIPIFENIGARVNLISPLSSSLAVMFLYLIIVMFIEYYNGKSKNISDIIIINCSAFIAALTFAFTDSHWFNAVESEVYALSTFFTAIILWLTMKWASETKEGSWNIRYLLLIIYLIGLSTGVHNLNLLIVPVIGLIIFFKKSNLSNRSIIEGIICTTLLLLLILSILMSWKIGILYFVILAGLVIYLFQKQRTQYIHFVKASIAILSVFFIIYSGVFTGLPIIANQISNFNLFIFMTIIFLIGAIIMTQFHSKINLVMSYKDVQRNNPLISIFVVCITFVFLFLTYNATISDPAKQIKRNFQIREQKVTNSLSRSKLSLVTKMRFENLNSLPSNSLSTEQKDSVDMYNQLLITPLEQLPKELHEGATVIKSNIQDLNDLVTKLGNDKSNIQDSLLLINNKMESKIGIFGLLGWQSIQVLCLFVLMIIIVITLGFYFYKNDISYDFTNIISVVSVSLLLIIIGYSTYTLVYLRAQQKPNINMNNPDNERRFLYYMDREQYGKVEPFNKNNAMTGQMATNWKRWTDNEQKMESNTSKEISNFTWEYQIKEMYLRYFAWQFIGRLDKDDANYRNIDNFNYIQKINNYIKVAWPRWSMKDSGPKSNWNIEPLDGINWGRYYIPFAFIFGILGAIYHFIRDWRRALSIMVLFLVSGVILSLYLNMPDSQPRERDYVFIGSYLAFSIWIGIGIAFFQQKIKTFFENSNISSFISSTIAVIIILLMPYTMYSQDFIQHNRKHNYAAWNYAYNILNSCEPNAILFTSGDNDTYPLWYLQEVEKIREDIIVVNFSLLNTPWYIEQLLKKIPDLSTIHNRLANVGDYKDIYDIEQNQELSTKASWDICGYSELDFSKDVYDLYEEVDFIKNQNNHLQIKYDCSLPILNSNKNESLKFTLPAKPQSIHLMIEDYMVLEIINNFFHKRPIYFVDSRASFFGLGKYLIKEGMVKRLFNNWDAVLDWKTSKHKLEKHLAENSMIAKKSLNKKNTAILKRGNEQLNFDDGDHGDMIVAKCYSQDNKEFQCGYGEFKQINDTPIFELSIIDLDYNDIKNVNYYYYSIKENKVYHLVEVSDQSNQYDNVFIKGIDLDYIDYNKMEANILQSENINQLIKNPADYINAQNNNKGIYRYNNFNKKNIYYNDNIKNHVMHYRSLYLDVLQNEFNNIVSNLNSNTHLTRYEVGSLQFKTDSEKNELRAKNISSFDINDVVMINNEKMLITQITSGKLKKSDAILTVERGYDNTIQTQHKSNASIFKLVYIESYFDILNSNAGSLDLLLNQVSNYFPDNLLEHNPKHSLSFLNFYYKYDMKAFSTLKNRMLEKIDNQDQLYKNIWIDNLNLSTLDPSLSFLQRGIENRDYTYIDQFLLKNNKIFPLGLSSSQKGYAFNSIYDNYKKLYQVNKANFNLFTDLNELVNQYQIDSKEYMLEKQVRLKSKSISKLPMGLKYVNVLEKLHDILINKFDDEDYLSYIYQYILSGSSYEQITEKFIKNEIFQIKKNINSKHLNVLNYEINAIQELLKDNRIDTLNLEKYKNLLNDKLKKISLKSQINRS